MPEPAERRGGNLRNAAAGLRRSVGARIVVDPMPSSFPSALADAPGPDTYSTPRVRVAAGQIRELECWAAESYPLEACGLLIGRADTRETHVLAVRRARNTNAERAHDRFELDPVDHLACEEEARALGLEVVGVWHSHPDRPATPSDLDRANAWARWSYVIVAVDARGAHGVRSWRFADGECVEESVVIG